jgi:hypothetical protein
MFKALDTMSKDTKGIKKYVEDIEGTMVKNIIYFIYSLNHKGCHGPLGRLLQDVGKALRKCFWGQHRAPKDTKKNGKGAR